MKSSAIRTILPLLLYVFTNGMIFLVHGVYWDDLTLFHVDRDAIYQQFYGNGAIYCGYLHILLQNTANPVFIYHFLIFLIGLCNVYLFGIVLKEVDVSESIVFYSSLLFAVYPLGYAHMTMICLPYQIGLLFLLLSMLIYLRINKQYNHGLLLLYFMTMFISSAFLPSVIVFCFGIICVMSVVRTWSLAEWSWTYLGKLMFTGLKEIIFFVPCLIYWTFRKLYFMPTGIYAAYGHNTITIDNAVRFPLSFVESVRRLLEWLLSMPYEISGSLFLIFMCGILIIVFYLLTKKSNIKIYDGEVNSLLLIFSFLYIFGIAAYLLVNDIQRYNSMEDRHAILLQLSVPVIIALISYKISNGYKYKESFMSVILSIFVLTSLVQYCNAIIESQKNDAVIKFFQTTPLSEGNVRIFDYYDRFECTRFYTYAGLYREATGKQDRCFQVNEDSLYDTPEFRTVGYNQKDALSGPIGNNIKVSRTEYKFYKYVVLNTIHYYTNKQKYYERLDRVFSVNFAE